MRQEGLETGAILILRLFYPRTFFIFHLRAISKVYVKNKFLVRLRCKTQSRIEFLDLYTRLRKCLDKTLILYWEVSHIQTGEKGLLA